MASATTLIIVVQPASGPDEAFSPETHGTWTPPATKPDESQSPKAADPEDAPVASSTGEGFVATGSMGMGCVWCPATLLEDGRVLVVGGWDPRLSAELYDPTTGTLTTTGSPPVDHGHGASVRLANGRVLVVSALTAAAELYDAATEKFSAVPGSFDTVLETLSRPPAAEPVTTPVVLADGRVLLVGPAGAGIRFPAAGTYQLGAQLRLAGGTVITVTTSPIS